MSWGEPTYISTPRSCCWCGRDFFCVSGGGKRVCPSCRKPKVKVRPAPGAGPLKLSARERQIVSLVAQATMNKEIAWQLHLTVGTIKEYLFRIFRKTGLTNRTALAVWEVKRMAALNLEAQQGGSYPVPPVQSNALTPAVEQRAG